jgi:hypothetical protein
MKVKVQQGKEEINSIGGFFFNRRTVKQYENFKKARFNANEQGQPRLQRKCKDPNAEMDD